MSAINMSCPPPRRGVVVVNPHSNETLEDGSSEPSSVRTYFGNDLPQAITEWGGLNGQPAAVADALEIVRRVLAARCTDIHEVYFPKSKQYVAILPRDRWNKAVAWLNRGFVDHDVELPGSQVHRHVYRSKLHTFVDRGPSNSTVEIPKQKCPTCHYQVSVFGECGCGWRPDPYLL